MRPLAAGAQLMQHGWLHRAMTLRENASHIARNRDIVFVKTEE